MTTRELDTRGLQPPEPIVRILAALTELGFGEELRVIMDREPLLLYPELERRGYAWSFTGTDGHGVLVVREAA